MIDFRSFKAGWLLAMRIAELWVARNVGQTSEESLNKANELCFELERYFNAALDEVKTLDRENIDTSREHRVIEDFGYLRVIYADTNEELWLDTLEPYVFGEERPCGACGHHRTAEGHDPCIANLPGVNYACCGHGTREGYISFSNGTAVYGLFHEVVHFKLGFGIDKTFDLREKT